MIHQVSVSVILDRRYQHKDGRFPIKLRLTYQNRKRLYGIGLALSEDEFRQVQLLRPRGKAKQWKADLGQVVQKAEEVVQKMNRFSFLAFQRLMFGDSRRNLNHWYQAKIDRLRKGQRWSTLEIYTNSRNTMPGGLLLGDITPAWLMQYEKRMKGAGRSDTTISIYLRALRTILNEARTAGAITEQEYPFGRGGYQIPKHRNIKKALTIEQVRTLFALDLPDPERRRAVDLFLFSYLCNGINMADIARLRWSDIDGDQIAFQRTKLHARRGRGRTVKVYLTAPARTILDRWGNPDRAFIFGICSRKMNEWEQRRAVKLETRRVNSYLKKIARTIPDLPDTISFNFARHSFATVLKRQGVPVSFISEALGHSSERVTEHYLASFQPEQYKDYLSKLV